MPTGIAIAALLYFALRDWLFVDRLAETLSDQQAQHRPVIRTRPRHRPG
jgi:hypothetical protein